MALKIDRVMVVDVFAHNTIAHNYVGEVVMLCAIMGVMNV